MVGIRDSQLPEQMQINSQLTLASAIALVRQKEVVKSQQKELRGTSPIVGAIHKLGVENSRSRKDQTCPKCGRSPLHDRQQYTMSCMNHGCRKCKKKKKQGHFQVAPANVSGLQYRKLSQENNEFMGALSDKKQLTEQWEVILKVNSRPVKFHIDTGAEVTVISTPYWKIMLCMYHA